MQNVLFTTGCVLQAFHTKLYESCCITAYSIAYLQYKVW